MEYSTWWHAKELIGDVMVQIIVQQIFIPLTSDTVEGLYSAPLRLRLLTCIELAECKQKCLHTSDEIRF